MVARVNSCPPNAHADKGKHNGCDMFLLAEGCIYGGNEHVGSVQRGNGCKHVGVLSVDRVKDINA